MGYNSVRRVPQAGDYFSIWEVFVNQVRSLLRENIGRGEFSFDSPVLSLVEGVGRAILEKGKVKINAFLVFFRFVKEMDFFFGVTADLRMLHQTLKYPGGGGLHGSDSDEIGT